MQVLISIDDTDDIDSRGTGQLAEEMADNIVAYGWGKTTNVTRHQLLVHPDIPYTSHNSAMCFQAEIKDCYYNDFIKYAAKYLQENSATVADPGLCVVQKDTLTEDRAALLIEFGNRAKKEIVTKTEAYVLAERLGVHLSEHGGTGIGVIGALAGAGLRLSGNDGRFKGKIKFNQATQTISVLDIKAQTIIEVVKSLDDKTLDDKEIIEVHEPLKAVLLDNKCVLMVNPKLTDEETNKYWSPCSKQQIRKY